MGSRCPCGHRHHTSSITIYPTGKTNTKTNQRLQYIVDTTEIRKFISGENTGDQDEWKNNLWKIPAVQVWSNLLFKFEDFTDMINGEFVNDLAGPARCYHEWQNSDLLRRRCENRNYGLDYLQKFQRGACFLELLSGQRSTGYDPKPSG